MRGTTGAKNQSDNAKTALIGNVFRRIRPAKASTLFTPPFFVAWSAQNVDRTVTLYKACLKARRTLVVDLYTADVMQTLAEFGRLPRPGWMNLKVVFTKAFVRMYKSTGRQTFLDQMVQYGISASELTETPGKWVAMIRPSLIRNYVDKGVTPDPADAWCWSMWRGYLETDDGAEVSKWFKKSGSHVHYLHTSGHASPSDLQSFARAIHARQFVPIHGADWDGDTTGFPAIRRLNDGESMTL